MSNWLSPLFVTDAPLLPVPWIEQLYLRLGWGLVLAALAAWGLQCRDGHVRGWRGTVPVALLLWCLWGGPWSPTYWLGLAWRAPSVLLVLLAAGSVLQFYRSRLVLSAPWPALRQSALWFIALGWLLLLDTLAVWPLSLYAWGFAPATLGGLALAVALAWAWRLGATLPLWLGAALLLHVLLRWPDGNVWGVWLDPGLWLWLQVDWIRRKVRRH